jgi:hypothetical protein
MKKNYREGDILKVGTIIIDTLTANRVMIMLVEDVIIQFDMAYKECFFILLRGSGHINYSKIGGVSPNTNSIYLTIKSIDIVCD